MASPSAHTSPSKSTSISIFDWCWRRRSRPIHSICLNSKQKWVSPVSILRPGIVPHYRRRTHVLFPETCSLFLLLDPRPLALDPRLLRRHHVPFTGRQKQIRLQPVLPRVEIVVASAQRI